MLPALVMLSLLFCASCILLPELTVEVTDAAVSSPPVIDSSADPYEFPGPFTLLRDEVNQDITLTIIDNDLDDTLHLRLFLDYNDETGAFLVSNCTAPASGSASRVVSCPTDRICSPLDSADTSNHSLEIAVSDRDWLTAGDPDAEGQPPLREKALDGNRVVRGWVMNCQ